MSDHTIVLPRAEGRVQLTLEFLDSPPPKQEEPKAVEPARATARRLVGILNRQSGIPFDALWVLAYHELFRATGYHAVSDNPESKVILDNVAQAGRLEDLVTALAAMLTEPKYGAKS